MHRVDYSINLNKKENIMGFTCEIKYPDNPNGVFVSGQTLTGAFILNLDKITKIKCIKQK